MFIILTMVTISQACRYVKTSQVVSFKYAQFMTGRYTSGRLFKNKCRRSTIYYLSPGQALDFRGGEASSLRRVVAFLVTQWV